MISFEHSPPPINNKAKNGEGVSLQGQQSYPQVYYKTKNARKILASWFSTASTSCLRLDFLENITTPSLLRLYRHWKRGALAVVGGGRYSKLTHISETARHRESKQHLTSTENHRQENQGWNQTLRAQVLQRPNMLLWPGALTSIQPFRTKFSFKSEIPGFPLRRKGSFCWIRVLTAKRSWTTPKSRSPSAISFKVSRCTARRSAIAF